jgi:putative MATE family efflux protein
VAEPLYVLADTAIVGRLGTEELAGVALATTVLLMVHTLAIFLTYGTTAAVARLMGAGRDDEAVETSVQSLWLAVLLGLGFAVALAVGGTPLMRALGGEGPALAFGQQYLGVSLFGLPFLLMMMAGAGVFTGRQDTRTPLVIAVISALANLIIELILIPGLGFGVGASALSTVMAQAGAGSVYVVAVLGWSRSSGVSLMPDWPVVARLMVAGRALILRAVALRGSLTLGAVVAARVGVAELAAHQIGLQVWTTTTLVLDAIAIAGQALTGRWLGAGDGAAAKGAARRMIELDIGFGLLVGIGLLAVRGPVASIFTNDPAVVAGAAVVLFWVAVAQPLNGYVFALDGILIGAGDLAYLGRAMALSAAVFAVGVWWLLETERGLGPLWAWLTVLMALRAITLWWRYRSDRWLVTGASPTGT